MVLVRGSPRTYIASILDVIGCEVVVALRDGSAHSIVLHDENGAEALAGYLQDVLEGDRRVVDADASGGDFVLITKE